MCCNGGKCHRELHNGLLRCGSRELSDNVFFNSIDAKKRAKCYATLPGFLQHAMLSKLLQKMTSSISRFRSIVMPASCLMVETAMDCEQSTGSLHISYNPSLYLGFSTVAISSLRSSNARPLALACREESFPVIESFSSVTHNLSQMTYLTMTNTMIVPTRTPIQAPATSPLPLSLRKTLALALPPRKTDNSAHELRKGYT